MTEFDPVGVQLLNERLIIKKNHLINDNAIVFKASSSVVT